MENKKSGIKFPSLTGGYETDLDLIENILEIYSLMKRIKLRPYEKTVLKYYIKYGYSTEVRDMISEDIDKSINNVKVAETSLRKLGFLKKGTRNERKTQLSEDMESLRRQFIIEKKRVLAILFKKD